MKHITLAIAFAACGALGACGGTSATRPSGISQWEGAWAVRRVNGQQLPATLPQGVDTTLFVSETFLLVSDSLAYDDQSEVIYGHSIVFHEVLNRIRVVGDDLTAWDSMFGQLRSFHRQPDGTLISTDVGLTREYDKTR